MSELPRSQRHVTHYPAGDAAFAATLETSLRSIHGRPIADAGIRAAVEALLRASYPLATVRDHLLAADRPPAWEAFRDDAVRDAEMLTRASAGDVTAFEELYDRHSGSAFGLALRITNDLSLAEEVVQVAFLSLWRSASSFDPARASVRTWLLSITHHRAIDAVRRRRVPTTELETAAGGRIVDSHLLVPDVWPEVSAHLDQRSVQNALASLPASQRATIEMAYFGGLTQVEIAAQLDIPLGTVKSRIRLGLAALRVHLAVGGGDSATSAPSPL